MMIARWNKVVGHDDLVYVLGDYALGDWRHGLKYLHRMAGTKILITGNHDHCAPTNKKGWQRQRDYLFDPDTGTELFTAIQDFAEVSLPPVHKNGQHRRVLLSHYPYTGDHENRDDRYAQFRLRDLGQPLLHGHIHDNAWVERSSHGSVMFNVGVDVNGFTPVCAEEVHRVIRDFESSGEYSWDPPADQFRRVNST